MAKRKPRSAADLLGDESPKRQPGNSRGPLPGYQRATANPHRDALYAQQARIAELKADQLAGKLVSVADVERRWTAAIIDCRQRMLAIPARITGLSRKHRDDLEKAIRAALEELADAGGSTPHAGKR